MIRVRICTPHELAWHERTGTLVPGEPTQPDVLLVKMDSDGGAFSGHAVAFSAAEVVEVHDR